MLSPKLIAVAKDAGQKQRRGETSTTFVVGSGGSSNVLMYAAQQGNVERVRQLIHEQRPLLFERDRSGKTPLHYSCSGDKKRAAQVADYLVMAAPELVEGKDEDGFTPLHLAVIAGNMPLVTFLLANNADVNAIDNEKHTVVHWATVCGETEALRAVLSSGAKVSTPDVHKGYPLHYAAQMCGGNDKDASLGFQVLQTLLVHNQIDVKVEDGDGRQPLLWAASAGSAKAVLALIRAGSPVEAADKDGLTALHCAASRGHTDCIDTLLTLCGAAPDVIDSNGCTALHYAVTLGHADATAILLAHGSDPNRQDRKGRSPAHCGCAKGQFETVKMIGTHGANLWLKNARGDIPLHEAAASGRRDLVKWLLAMRPSQVNARNNDGRCPLHLAALNDNADMCKILLDAGAQINPVLRTSKNAFMTPLDCALRRGFRSTAKYLQLHGGVPANRLGSGQHQNINSGVSLQIRDDITFWGDTSSDSERENGEMNKHLKSQRKKLAQKYERKRASVSGSDLDDKLIEKGRNSRKYSDRSRASRTKGSASSSFDPTYLNKRSSKSRFDYTNEITINGNTEINIHQTREISLGHEPDKFVTEKETNKLTSSQHFKIETPKEKERHSRPKSAKHGIKSKTNKSDSERSSTAKSSASSLNVTVRDESKRQYLKDQGTNTAEELQAEHSKVSDTKLPEVKDHEGLNQNFKTSDRYSRISDTSEDQEKQEIVVEAAIHEPPKDSAPEEEKLENSHGNLEIAVSKTPLNEDVQTFQDDKNVELDKKKDVDGNIDAKDDPETSKNEKETVDVEVSGTPRETDVKTDEESRKHIGNLEKILSHETFLRNQEEETDQPNESSAPTCDSQKGVINLNIQQELSLKIHGFQEEEDVSKTETNEGVSQKTEDTSTTDNVNSVDTVREISEAQLNSQAVEDDEKLRPDTLDNVFGEVISNQATAVTKEEKLKREGKTEEIFETASDDSLTSSITENRTHKSFTVLDENEATERKTTKTGGGKSIFQKQRSKSEENERGKERVTFKPSKIPTPLGKSMLSKSDRHLNISHEEPAIKHKIQSLPDMNTKDRMREPYRSQSNISARKVSIYSDEKGSGSEDAIDERRTHSSRKRRTKRKSHRRDSKSAGSDYESSNIIDSGFEPSPRSTRVPRWKNMSERGVNMTSVTQGIQSNIRRFHLERKIFQHLLDLKRMQIRSGQHNEAMLVKRAIDAYHNSCASTVGAGRYIPNDLSFKSFEKFLYDALRKLQKNSDYLKGLPEAPSNPLLCTRSTHRCMHATHAYTGVPCAAYLPKIDHHSIPKIGFNSCKPGMGGFLPNINPKKSVTLELCHGNDKQVISLPADRLDQNKRYYVTFTVKGNETQSESNEPTQEPGVQKHSRSD